MFFHEHFMQRALDLARHGAGTVSPNPMVGAVLVCNGRIVGEGWHRKFGEAHAEVNAFASLKEEIQPGCTLYVNLEPCSHYGKTPPCADLITNRGVKKVVIGMRDPNPLVAGAGVGKLREAGVEVVEDVLNAECLELNRRFVTWHAQNRPYIILKWAQTRDGFIAPDLSAIGSDEYLKRRNITGYEVQKLVHRWRSEEDAILVGTGTVKADDPALNVRAWTGRNPHRITYDRNMSLPPGHKFFDATQPTLVFTEQPHYHPRIPFVTVDFNENLPQQVAHKMFGLGLQSLVVEGGARTLNEYLKTGLWDEAQVFTDPKMLHSGVQAPSFSAPVQYTCSIGTATLTVYRNK